MPGIAPGLPSRRSRVSREQMLHGLYPNGRRVLTDLTREIHERKDDGEAADEVSEAPELVQHTTSCAAQRLLDRAGNAARGSERTLHESTPDGTSRLLGGAGKRARGVSSRDSGP